MNQGDRAPLGSGPHSRAPGSPTDDDVRHDPAPPEGWWPVHRSAFWNRFGIHLIVLAVAIGMYLLGYVAGRSG